MSKVDKEYKRKEQIAEATLLAREVVKNFDKLSDNYNAWADEMARDGDEEGSNDMLLEKAEILEFRLIYVKEIRGVMQKGFDHIIDDIIITAAMTKVLGFAHYLCFNRVIRLSSAHAFRNLPMIVMSIYLSGRNKPTALS